MQTYYEYRSYVISHDGAAFSAESIDGESFQIRSKNMLRLTRAIDALWNAVDGKVPTPSWVYASDLVDLDAATDVMLIVDRPAFVSTFPLGPVVGVPARAAA
jgi:hypothetical protein